MRSAKDIAREAVEDHKAAQKEGELARTLTLLRRIKPRNILEIGGFFGGTAWAFDQVKAPGKTVIVDSFRLEGRLEEAVNFEHINANSQDPLTLEAVKDAFGGEPVDFLFIDGDHSYACVRQDFRLYAPLVRSGGMIGFHDVSVEQVARNRGGHDVIPLWNQVRRFYKHEEIYEEPKTPPEKYGGIGILFVEGQDVPEIGEPTDEDRIGRVMLDEPCGKCGRKLIPLEEVLCAACAA
jgi:predicted O-methyltransferase YrrM